MAMHRAPKVEGTKPNKKPLIAKTKSELNRDKFSTKYKKSLFSVLSAVKCFSKS